MRTYDGPDETAKLVRKDELEILERGPAQSKVLVVECFEGGAKGLVIEMQREQVEDVFDVAIDAITTKALDPTELRGFRAARDIHLARPG